MIRKTLILLLCWIVIIGSVGGPVAAENEENQAEEPEAQEEAIENSAQEAEESPSEIDSREFLALPPGTPLRLVMLEQLYSQRNYEGDEIVFALEDDVVLMGRTYLVEGTPVIGRVTHARPARSWGRSGTLDIEITSIVPAYGMPIRLTGEAGESGGSRSVQAIGTTVLLGISVVGLLAGGSVSGSGAVIEAGRDIMVYTAEEGTIADIPEEDMRAIVDDWYRDRVISAFLDYSWDHRCTVADAIESLGYTVDESAISIEQLEDYFWAVSVQLTPAQSAEFTFQLFQEYHGGKKFITLQARNDLAEEVYRAIR